jgi:hypothetical protein
MQGELPIRIQVHWLFKIILNAGPLFFLGLTLFALTNGFNPIVLFFAGFTALGLLGAVLSWSYIEVDEQQLTVFRAPFWKFAINWNEVKRLEIGSNGIAFCGDDKVLIMNLSMADANSQRLANYISQEVNRRNIHVKQVVAIRWTQKNTRVN